MANFMSPGSGGSSMYQLSGSKRLQDGINVFWKEGGREENIYLSFGQLVDMKVNALDLLEHPKNYQIDPKKKKIEFKV
jgi:cyclophilin family peptidyl-prolyl cis-trans isomerase